MDISKEFDAYYVISLPKRGDRRVSIEAEMKKMNIEFEFFDAIDGSDQEVKFHNEDESIGWNKGAAALLHTTINLINHAKEKGHETILIMEDDVFFSLDAKEYLSDIKMPDKEAWDMFFFGFMESIKSFPIERKLVRVRSAFCCHCYALNSRVFDDYLHYLSQADRPIDWITSQFFQPMGRCLGTKKSIAHQKPDYSNIREKHVHNRVS